MNNLDKTITENRDHFDHFEPPEGHYEKFRTRLDGLHMDNKPGISYFIKVAAVLVLVSVTSIIIYKQINRLYFQPDRFTLSDISTEYKEVEQYFISSINHKYSEIEQLNIQDPEQKEILLKEIDEMDNLFKSMQQDLKANPNDERIIHAMINHYQMKLEVMNQIVTQLIEIQQITSNNNNYENKEI